jgi:hypothetical protein
VPEASLDLSAVELQSSRERESDQPSHSRTEGAAKKAYEGALAPIRAGVVYLLLEYMIITTIHNNTNMK